MKTVLLGLLGCYISFTAISQTKTSLSSPDGRIRFEFSIDKGQASYQVSFNKKPVILSSGLALQFSETETSQAVARRGKPVYRMGTEIYELVVGKTSRVNQSFEEVIIPLQEKTAPYRAFNLMVRAFNEGLGFRYEFPTQEKWPELELWDEQTQFRLPGNPQALALFLPGYTSSHEGEYHSLPLLEIKEDTLIDMPVLFELPDRTYLAITEAALLDYAGMYLKKKNNILVSSLSPLPEKEGLKVKARLPHHSPWRVLLISDRIGDLFESNIITSLNEPSRIKDVSWIKPGKTTFPWWNGSIIPDTTFAPGNNFENNKYYIDFCARNGIEYHSVVESNGHEWYTNDGEGYQPGPGADVTKPVSGIDMKEICDYAHSKGVGIRVWVHWKALYPKLDTAFALFEQWGISGMMVDFMDRDDQEMIRIKAEILTKAARHKLHIQFHGVEKPTGLSRTFPNEWTREGTLNYEVNKWEKRITPDHDLNIVYTRMLAGPTDYHLGGFRAVPDSLFKVQYTRPLMLGTRAHMLAMYVVLESYLGMVCDFPAAYEGQPGFDFIKEVPTVWDELKALDGEIGKYIIIARRKGTQWFIGAINNREPKTIRLNLNFLQKGIWKAHIYRDAPDAGKNPNALIEENKELAVDVVLDIPLAAGGGMVIKLSPK